MVVVLPPMLGAHRASWAAVVELSQRLPDSWTLVGGQMVLLHCWERATAPARPTEDADAVVDVRTRPSMLRDMTSALLDMGFRSAGSSPSGHEHRWVRDGAQVDVLLPDGIGGRAAGRAGATGSTTLETPGGTAALTHTERLEVRFEGLVAAVPRPHLAGALLAKSRALLNPQDPHPGRHAVDIAVLASMVGRADVPVLREVLANRKSRATLGAAIARLGSDRAVWVTVEGADAGVARLAEILGR